MFFLINLFNLNEASRKIFEDPVRIIEHQLRALGHKVELSNDQFVLADEGVNLIFENFNPAATAEIAAAKADGARFLFVATEEPTPKGWNHGLITEALKRYNEFPNAAKHCEGILYLIPGAHVHAWYSQWAPSAFIELGYAPTLVRPAEPFEPTFDFGFFGSMTQRRYKVLKRLSKYVGSQKAVRIESMFPTAEARDKVMREARVILQIRKDNRMGYVSSMRCNVALHLGRPVIAEPHDLADQSPWSKIVKFSESSETFLQDALLMRCAWQGVHSAQFEKFRSVLTPQFCIGRALEEIRLDT